MSKVFYVIVIRVSQDRVESNRIIAKYGKGHLAPNLWSQVSMYESPSEVGYRTSCNPWCQINVFIVLMGGLYVHNMKHLSLQDILV